MEEKANKAQGLEIGDQYSVVINKTVKMFHFFYYSSIKKLKDAFKQH